MRTWFCLLGLSACGLSEVDVRLASFDTEAAFDHLGSFSFSRPGPGGWGPECPVLPAATTATWNGNAPDEIDLGRPHRGVANSESCISPFFRWFDRGETTGPSTIEVDDGETVWTFVVWKPFEMRGFTLPSHPTGRIRAGDRVTARVDFMDGAPLKEPSFVRGSNGLVLFDLDQENGLVRDGWELRFTMPAVPTGPLELWIEAKPDVVVDRCDAPRGCIVSGRAASMLDVTIIP